MNNHYIKRFMVGIFLSAAAAYSQSSIYEAGGNVGIGASPSAGAKLSISASVNNSTLLRLDGPGPGGGYYLNFADASIGGQGFGRAFLRWTRDNNLGRAFSIITSDDLGNSAERLIVDTHGYVGIGTANPASKLSVVGSYVDTNTPQLDVDGGPAGAVLTLSSGGIRRGKVRVDAGGGIALESSGVGGVAINYSGGSGDTTIWNGQGSGLMVIKHDGSVGIGTTAPLSKLEVRADGVGLAWAGRIALSNYTADKQVFLGTYNTNSVVGSHNYALNAWTPIYVNTTDGSSTGANVLIAGSGNVGIGTANPTQKLSVNGTVRAKEVIVEMAGWSDYVLAKDYALASLSEVEQHIQNEGRLPGIPSAQEVAEKGIGVGEMQAKLLAKIEELTLHQIEQEKEISAIRRENAQLQSRLLQVEHR